MCRRRRCRTLDVMTNTTTTTSTNPIRNGVDTATLFATLDAVKGDHDIADFQFRATNRWVSGTHNRVDDPRLLRRQAGDDPPAAVDLDADHPAVLVGDDHGPTPVEYVLHALAACLTAGIANIAAARGDRARRGRRPPSRATSTCSASSACPTRSATASSRSASASPSRATTPRSCARSSSSRGSARPSTTSLTNGVPVSIEVDAADPPTDRLAAGRAHRTMRHRTDTLVIGAGQAGLAAQPLPHRARRDHVVLERGRIGRALAQRDVGLAPPADAELDERPARLGRTRARIRTGS